MAVLEKLLPFIEKWEGGYVNDPQDLGGATNRGITVGAWKTVGYDKDGDGNIDEKDVRLLTREDFVMVLRDHYWNRCQADRIQSQAIANMLVDWVWCSGAVGIKQVQTLLGVKVDGVVGEKTLCAINSTPSRELFYQIQAAREEYVETICNKREANLRFRKGWLRRIDAIKWTPVCLFLILLLVASGCRSSANYAGRETRESVSEQMSIAKESAQLEEASQSASSFHTLQVGEVLEMTVHQVEYDTLSPAGISRETRVWINKRMDARQEETRTAGTERQARLYDKEEMHGETVFSGESNEVKAGSRLGAEWWWILVGLGMLGVVWRVRK